MDGSGWDLADQSLAYLLIWSGEHLGQVGRGF
jgi:hypothetical protein